MRLELTAAVVVAAGVIQRDAALPELRRLIGDGLRQLVKRRGGFGKAPLFEISHCAIQDRLWALLFPDAESRHKSQNQHRRFHVPSSIAI